MRMCGDGGGGRDALSRARRRRTDARSLFDFFLESLLLNMPKGDERGDALEPLFCEGV